MSPIPNKFRRTYGARGQRRDDPYPATLLRQGFLLPEVLPSSSSLQNLFPASDYSGSFQIAFSGSLGLPVTYQSNGTVWSQISSGGGGSVDFTVTTVSTSTTADAFNVILVDASGGDVVITLPAAAAPTFNFYNIKKIDFTQNSVIVKTTGAERIDGETNITFSFPNQVIEVVTDNSNWFTL